MQEANTFGSFYT